MRNVVLAIAAVAIVALIAWFGFHNRQGRGNAGFGHRGGPPQVTTITATVGQIPIEEVLPGRTTAYRVAEIRPQVGGIVRKRLFTEGGDVKAGDHLYQLDPSMYRAAMQSASANLEQAKATEHVAALKARRYKNLLGTRAISQQDYDDAAAALSQAKAAVDVARASVATAKLNLAYTEVYAPIPGRIGKSTVTEGALVTANQSQALAVITQLDPIYVDMQQSSTDNMRLRAELGRRSKVPVTITVGDAKSYPHAGVLQFSEVSVDASTGAVELRALLPNPDHELLPGMFVTATLDLGVETAIAVPQQAVSRNLKGEAYVWEVGKDDKVHQHIVTTERAYKNEWVISKGLTAGDVLVFEGVQRLMPGIKVVPHPRETAG